MSIIDTFQNNPLGAVLGVVAILSAIGIGGAVGERMRPNAAYLLSAVLLIGLLLLGRHQGEEGRGIIPFGLFATLGIFLGAGSKANKYKTGEWPKPKRPKPAPVVAAPPPPPPPSAPVPQTVIHYTDNRDQSIRIDNSVHVTVGAMTPEAARALFGLPMHFTRQRLENAYEDKIRLLDSQAQALPRGDQQSRLLISQKEDQLEQAYKVLRG